MKKDNLEPDLIEFPEESSEDDGLLKKGDNFFRSSNVGLVVCLTTLGVKPFKLNPLVKKRLKDGTEELFFNLETKNKDGDIDCMECLQYWKSGTKFIEENPLHPFAVAMATMMNRRSILDLIKKKKSTIQYVLPDGPSIFVTEGTKKHKALKEKYGY